MQLYILLFFQKIRTPFLTLAANAASFLGELPVPLLVTVFIYWCISKRKGAALLLTEISALSLLQVLKSIFRFPRPFMKHPELIKPIRESTATGYSFPSGHSATAAVFYGTLAKLFKKKWIAAASAAIIILVPLSRLYLGVHWPADVFFGTFLGLLSAAYLPGIFMRIYDSRKSLRLFSLIFSPIALTAAMASALLLDLKGADVRLLKNLMETAAIGAGAAAGMFLESEYADFTPADSWAVRIAAMLIGLIAGGAVVLALRSIPYLKYTGKFLGYLFFGLWCTFLYPMIGKKVHLFS